MNSEHHLKLEDAQKKLTAFRNHLDLLVRGVWESQNVSPQEVLQAVTELESLVEWAALQPDLGTESVVLLVKLQELHRIRQNLEHTPTVDEEHSVNAVNEAEENKLTENAGCYLEGSDELSDNLAENLSYTNNETNEEHHYNISSDIHNLLYCAECPEIAEDITFPRCDITETILKLDEKEDWRLKNGVETDLNDKDERKESSDIFMNTKNNITEQDLLSCDTKNFEKIALIKDLHLSNIEPLSANNTEIHDLLSSDTEIFSNNNSVVKDLISSNSEELAKSNIEIQNFLLNYNEVFEKSIVEPQDLLLSDGEDDVTEIKDLIAEDSITEIKDLITKDTEVLQDETVCSAEEKDLISKETEESDLRSFRNEVIILETNDDEKTTEWVNDPKCSNDPLDICMFAIRNLYDSLRVKENELLKLSVIQNDQKHIEALQGVIIDFHKDITNLNSQLDKTKKENAQLKEQVLELEEAENDARSAAQKLEQKLAFLQEKDSHSQAEIAQLKKSLNKSVEIITEKELSEKELRSQLKYTETLVQKYEDQIKLLETKEILRTKKSQECIVDQHVNSDRNCGKKVLCEKGSQTYVHCQSKSNNTEIFTDDISEGKFKLDSLNQNPEASNEPREAHNELQGTESLNSKDSLVPTSEATHVVEQVVLANNDKLSQKELLKRLHNLIDEDVRLQQQIHHVDEINLALWKKLQNLENNIDDCKRKDINETDLGLTDTMVNDDTTNAESQEQGDSPHFNIPEENLVSLDQNEQYIHDRLTQLEEINASFEKELKTREILCKEKEKKYEEWVQTERRLVSELKRLADERNCLIDQVVNLKKEKEDLEKRVLQQEAELAKLKENNEMEMIKIKAEQENVTLQHQHKVNQLIAKEKSLLKMISNLKTERNTSQGKSELERLKCNYIELQLELSHSREEIRKLEDKYKTRLDECASKHVQEEFRLTTELERLRNENMRCDKMIIDLQQKQRHLLNALERQEKELNLARENYRKSSEDTEEVHRTVETELKSQLQQIEEGTVIATTALMEERVRVEKDLQGNINDLRAKEEVYKARIAELELDVVHLHEELKSVSMVSERKMDMELIHENVPEDLNHKTKESKFSETSPNDVQGDPSVEHSLDKTDFPQLHGKTNITSSIANQQSNYTKSEESVDAKQDAKEHAKMNAKKDTKIDAKEDNIDHLRAQVRELQAHFEKLSGGVVEVSSPQPIMAIGAPCMGLKKEDIDYAEVDECVSAWRKPQLLSSNNKGQLQVQTVYGDKYVAEYKDDAKNQETSSLADQSSEENDYDEVLPRPTNFHVVQQVGSDTLLVGWSYVNPAVLDGFEVYLDNQVHERIYIPDRTKALISGLNLRKPIHLSICALSRYGQMSEPTVLELTSLQERNTTYFEEEDEDEYKDFDESLNNKQRPYSMEW